MRGPKFGAKLGEGIFLVLTFCVSALSQADPKETVQLSAELKRTVLAHNEKRAELPSPSHGEVELIHSGKWTQSENDKEKRFRIYREVIHLEEMNTWPSERSDYWNCEVKFPLMVKSREIEESRWCVEFLCFPNFNSPIFRLDLENLYEVDSGTIEDLLGEDGTESCSLVSLPSETSIKIFSTKTDSALLNLLNPGMLFAGFFSEGKLIRLEIGSSVYAQREFPVGRLSAPHFSRNGALMFRFATRTLNGNDVVFELSPERIEGHTFTDYDLISSLGPPFSTSNWEDDELEDHEDWAVVAYSNLVVSVLAPLIDGRGAPGILELESVDLDPSYMDLLRVLSSFRDTKPNLLPRPIGGRWSSILTGKLGDVPPSQRVSRSEQYSFRH